MKSDFKLDGVKKYFYKNNLWCINETMLLKDFVDVI